MIKLGSSKSFSFIGPRFSFSFRGMLLFHSFVVIGPEVH